MLASDHGPLLTSVSTLTHMTGSPCAADIISRIRAAMLTGDPMATLAASLVPSANTQQPRKPAWYQPMAARYPLSWPGNCSTMERPPEALIQTWPTPTSWYCAASRWAGSGNDCGDTIPTERESPICPTEEHEVWFAITRASLDHGRGAASGPADADRGADASGCTLCAPIPDKPRPVKTPAEAAPATDSRTTAETAAMKASLRLPPGRPAADASLGGGMEPGPVRQLMAVSFASSCPCQGMAPPDGLVRGAAPG